MAQYNVDRSREHDKFYRYKMPAIKAKVEGKGNGIKTVIDNCVDVARALSRPPEYVCKHFGFELGAQVQMNKAVERYIVNGAHEAEALQDKLDLFIKAWVLCTSCSNPETNLKVKDGAIMQACQACGFAGPLKASGRMQQYIVKTPPKSFGAQYAQKTTNEQKKTIESTPVTGNDQSPIHDGWTEKDEFVNETDATAIIDRMLQDLSGKMSDMTIASETFAELDPETRITLFCKHARRLKKSMGDQFLEQEGANQIANLCNVLQLGAFAPLAFKQFAKFSSNLMQEITEYASHLQLICVDESAQKSMIGVIELTVSEHRKKLLPYTAHLLKLVYDNDIVSDQVIIKWAEKPTKKFVKRSLVEKMIDVSAKFLEWLQEPDSSDEEDEENGEDQEESEEEQADEDNQVSFSKQAPEPEKISAKKPEQNTAFEESSDDDIDIDDI